MNSSIACRYPRFDSGERRLSRTADLLWSRSGRPSFDFGRFSFEDFSLACLLIPAASTAAGQEPMPARRRVGRYSATENAYNTALHSATSEGAIFRGSSLLQRATSESRPAAQGGVESRERNRGQEENPGETDARIPRRALRRQWECLQNTPEDVMSHHSQQAEADQQKHSHTAKDQITHQDSGSKSAEGSRENP